MTFGKTVQSFALRDVMRRCWLVLKISYR